MPKRLHFMHRPKTQTKLFCSGLRYPGHAALGFVIPGRNEARGSCGMSLRYEVGPHNYSMSLSRWFSHCLELIYLMDGIEKGQRRGSNINFPFPNHVSAAGRWLGKVLLFGFSEKLFKHLHFRRNATVEMLISPSPPATDFFPSLCCARAPCAERINLVFRAQ